ncbi:hypothetical protein CsSME_00037112 [Camellia sinensis var. sinensis]
MTDSHKRIAIDNGTDDIVSGLPRNLIDNILERMPVRDAARTSILSRNWRSCLIFLLFASKLLAAGPVPWVFSIPFNQLKHLVFTKIRFDDLDQMSCVLCLLRSSPNLKKLRMTASAVRENAVEPNPSYLGAPGFIFQMLNQLRNVKITSITGLRAELLFIKCILACSPFLETMHVQYHQIVDAHEGFRISTELMRFSRASPRAEIIYVKS